MLVYLLDAMHSSLFRSVLNTARNVRYGLLLLSPAPNPLFSSFFVPELDILGCFCCWFLSNVVEELLNVLWLGQAALTSREEGKKAGKPHMYTRSGFSALSYIQMVEKWSLCESRVVMELSCGCKAATHWLWGTYKSTKICLWLLVSLMTSSTSNKLSSVQSGLGRRSSMGDGKLKSFQKLLILGFSIS